MASETIMRRNHPIFLPTCAPLSFYDHERLYTTLLLGWTKHTERSEANRGKRRCETFIEPAEATEESGAKRSRTEEINPASLSKRISIVLLQLPLNTPHNAPLPISRQILPAPFRQTPHQRREVDHSHRRREVDLQNVISSFEVVLGCRLESWKRFEKIAGDQSRSESS